MTTADRLSARTVHTNPEHEDPHTKTLNGQKQAQSEANPVVSGRGDGMLDASLALLLGTNNAPSSRSKVRHAAAPSAAAASPLCAAAPPLFSAPQRDMSGVHVARRL